jgi:hypothetical protein
MYSLHATVVNLLDRLYYLTYYSNVISKDLKEDENLEGEDDLKEEIESAWYYSKKAYDAAIDFYNLTNGQGFNKDNTKLIQYYLDTIYSNLNKYQTSITSIELIFDSNKSYRKIEELHPNFDTIFNCFQTAFGYYLEANKLNKL